MSSPIFIPSRHRCEINGTARLFESLGINEFRFIVESDELGKYRDKFGFDRVLELPQDYQERYDTCDDFGLKLPIGSGPARNYAWDVAASEDAAWHWCIDDNLTYALFRYNARGFQRVRYGRKWLDELEALIQRYSNVVMGGPHDWKFIVHDKQKVREFIPNTRIYSCNLIRTNIPMRWRGRYNEDTILSLDILTAGFATVLANSHLMKKAKTNVMQGGNTEGLYRAGTGPKSRLLKIVYPQYVSVTKRFGRIHHYIDYRKHFLQIPLVLGATVTDPDRR